MINNYSHLYEFTQLMQMKSYHEWTLLCSVFTLDQLCSDHFHRLIHAKFLTTKRPISPPASRCWSLLKGLYFTAVVFSFFFRRLISEITEWISTKRGHIFTYDCYLKKICPNPNSMRTSKWTRVSPPPNSSAYNLRGLMKFAYKLINRLQLHH